MEYYFTKCKVMNLFYIYIYIYFVEIMHIWKQVNDVILSVHVGICRICIWYWTDSYNEDFVLIQVMA